MQPVSFPTRPTRELDSSVDFEIPPVTRCTTCLRFDCDGCRRPVERRALIWEKSRGRTFVRLWLTARQSITAARVSCLDAEPARPLAALAFGVLAELVACVSIVVALLLLVLVVFPSGAWFLFGQTRALAALFGLGAGLGLFMVLVHALWGFGLELALWCRGAGFRLQRGLAFAFYACGWDLLTSPIGVVLSVAQSGPVTGIDHVRQAARVPRAALVRYVTVSRGAQPDEATAIVRWSFLLPAVTTLGLIAWSLAAWLLV
jgi:hypothetical protein